MSGIKRRDFLGVLGAGVALSAAAGRATGEPTESQAAPATVERHAFESGRDDGRFVQTAALVHKCLATLRPKLAFESGITHEAFPTWQQIEITPPPDNPLPAASATILWGSIKVSS